MYIFKLFFLFYDNVESLCGKYVGDDLNLKKIKELSSQKSS